MENTFIQKYQKMIYLQVNKRVTCDKIIFIDQEGFNIIQPHKEEEAKNNKFLFHCQ